MKILLISGHGAGQPGACANGYREVDLTRELVNLIAPRLRKYAAVDVYDQSHNAFGDIEKGHFSPRGYDYVLEVHFNSFNGQAYGTEIFVTSSEKGTGVEQAIMNELSQFFKVRGVKRKDFLVIKTCKNRGMSAALLETCFIDNYNDIQGYQKNKDAIADAVVKGIAVGFGLVAGSTSQVEQPSYKPEPQPQMKSVEEIAREVLNGVWGNGVDRKARLESAGYNAAEVQSKVNELLGVSANNPSHAVSLEVGARVTLSSNASTYATGEKIPSKFKGQTYTVQQIGNGKVLLKELYSWVRNSDIVGTSNATSGSITKGSSVVVVKPYDVNGTHLAVSGTYEVIELKGSRAVIAKNGTVIAAVDVNNLKLA